MENTSKPSTSINNTSFKRLGDYTFDEVGSFTVEQLAGVTFDRQFSPVSNASRISHEETWDSNTTTWDSEVRSWNDMASLMDNTAKP